ncbi:sialate O-acetylesterase-like [Ciona intestinalis]
MYFICGIMLVLLPFTSGETFTKGSDEFAFASYYQNNMVLQMEPYRAVIWGYGTIGATVNISLIQDVYSTKVRAGPTGKGVWSVTLNSHAAGGPFMIQGVQDYYGMLHWILLKGVLFGDVWVCGGQSNMQFTVSMLEDPAKEVELASKYPDIRLLTVAELISQEPEYDIERLELAWSLPSKESLNGGTWSHFSAVCWIYGRHLFDALQVPIGLVASSYGGTAVEAWSSPQALKECGLEGNNKIRFNDRNSNSVLWNAMIHPLLNMTIKGTIWYQGEQNFHYHNAEYACSFPAMIKDWRKNWYEGTGGQTHREFPFGFVQLSTVNSTDDGSFSLIRWHQTANIGYAPNVKMPNTFMAVAMDLSDNESPFGSIHPRDKDDVAKRLVVGALNVGYGRKVEFQGPFPESVIETANNHLLVTYPSKERIIVKERGSFQVCCTSPCNISEPSPSPSWLWTPIVSHDLYSITLDCVGATKKAESRKCSDARQALTPCPFKQCSVYNDCDLPAPPFVIPINGK